MDTIMTQTTFCYCPGCDSELISGGNIVSSDTKVTYKCSNCGLVSEWLFDNLVPLLLGGE